MNDVLENNQDKSWLDRITQAFSSEPRSREDLVEILRAAHSNKILDSDALEIMEGALQVADQQVREIMIPRSQMVSIRYNSSLEEILALVIASNHSRFPVVGESSDDIKGILLAKELLPLLLECLSKGKMPGEGEPFAIDQFIRPATIIPESKRLNVLLREFREQRYHMAMVVDEYGGVSGLVTIEDILEEIVGDIEDETDEEEANFIRPLGDDHYLVAALTPIEAFNDHFDTGLSEEDFDTLGGLLMQTFGHLPAVGEIATLEDFTFKVVDGDRRQIRQLEMWINKNHQE